MKNKQKWQEPKNNPNTFLQTLYSESQKPNRAYQKAVFHPQDIAKLFEETKANDLKISIYGIEIGVSAKQEAGKIGFLSISQMKEV